MKINIRTIQREVFEYSNNIWNFKVAQIRTRIEIFVKNYSNIRYNTNKPTFQIAVKQRAPVQPFGWTL